VEITRLNINDNSSEASSPSECGRAERRAIQDAISALKILKRDSLNFPDWE